MPAGRPVRRRGAHRLGAARHVERRPGRPGRPLRRSCAGPSRRTRGCRSRSRSSCARPGSRRPPLHRLRDRRALRRVAARVEHDDVRRAVAGAERRQRPLARLVRRLAGDREAWYQRFETWPAAKPPKSGEERARRRSSASGDGRSDARGGRAWELLPAVRGDHERPRIRCAAARGNRPEGDRRATKVGSSDRLRSVFKSGRAAYADRGERPPPRPALLAVPEERGAPARRSRRDWVVDSSLFLLAARARRRGARDQVDRGLDGPLLVFDVIGGAALCLALWWRRRWPFALGLASVPIVAFSSSAGLAGLIVLFTVAAYRRWQLALLVAAAAARDAAGLPRRAARRRLAALGVLRRRRRWPSRRSSRGACSSAGAASRGASACAAPRPSSSCSSSRPATPSARASRARCTTCSPTGSRC